MTAVRYDVLTVTMSPLRSQRRTVPAWETDVLIAVQSGADVVVESHVTKEVDLPDAHSEMQRLVTRYGSDVEQGGIPHVSKVYGQQNGGITALQAAIDAAIVTPTSRAPKKEIA